MIDNTELIQNLTSSISEVTQEKKSISTQGFEHIRQFLVKNPQTLENSPSPVIELRDQLIKSMTLFIPQETSTTSKTDQNEDLITMGIFCKILRHMTKLSFFFDGLVIIFFFGKNNFF